MALVTHPEGTGEPAVLDTAVHPEMDPVADARRAGRPAMTWDDVAAMHQLLDTWSGDLRSLVRGAADGIGGGPDR